MANFFEQFKEFQDILQLQILSSQIIEGSEIGSGYIIVFLDEYEEEVFDILNYFGFQKVLEKSDLFVCALEDFSNYADKDSYDKILLKFSKYYSKKHENMIPQFRLELIEIWDNIRKEIFNINNLCVNKEKLKTEIICPVQNVLNSALKILNMVCINNDSFGEYCWRLYQFGYESISLVSGKNK